MKFSEIVHSVMPYCTSYFKFLSAWFWGFPEQNMDFAITKYMYGGTRLEYATPLRPLNRISWNFQELFTTWCHTASSILSFYSNDFGVSQSKTRTLPYKDGGAGVSFCEHLVYPLTLTLLFEPFFENFNLANSFWTECSSFDILH